jgi:hypothetical protein
MEKLMEHIASLRRKPSPWAIENGIAASVMSRYLKGEFISLKNLIDIWKATGGAVTLEDLASHYIKR